MQWNATFRPNRSKLRLARERSRARAPETANNAACTGSFVQLLTLNVSPGPRLMIDEPRIFWSVIMSMFTGNLVFMMAPH